jgi:hypothetical protein
MTGEMQITVDFSAWEKAAQQWPKHKAVLFAAAKRAMQEAVTQLRTSAIAKTRQEKLVGASGHYAQGFRARITGASLDALKGMVENLAGHHIFVELGRKPGKMPPYDAIALWVKRKGISKPGKFSKTAGKQSVKAFRTQAGRQKVFDGTVFMIRRAIARRGTIARYMTSGHGPAGARVLGQTYKAGRPHVAGIFTKHLNVALAQIASAGSG